MVWGLVLVFLCGTCFVLFCLVDWFCCFCEYFFFCFVVFVGFLSNQNKSFTDQLRLLAKTVSLMFVFVGLFCFVFFLLGCRLVASLVASLVGWLVGFIERRLMDITEQSGIPE